LLRCERSGGYSSYDNVRRQERQFACECGEAINFAFRPFQVQHKMLTFDISKLTESLLEGGHE